MEEISSNNKNILFIYNPNSGRGKVLSHLQEITDILKSQGHGVDVYETKAPLDGMNKVMKDAGQYGLVVCGGGDGTLSEVVSGMMRRESRVPIGFIPAGSTNDTRAGFGLPKDLSEAARLCICGNPRLTDVGRLNDEYFTYVASLGSLPAVSCFTSQEMKRIFGHGAYVLEGIRQLIKMESYGLELKFQDQVISGEFFMGMISNAESVGGFEGITGGSVDLSDGLFEVTMLKKPNNIIEFGKEVNKMLIHNKEDRQVLDDLVIRFKTDHLIIRSDQPVQWVRDGEDGGKHKEAQITVCKKAVTIMSAL